MIFRTPGCPYYMDVQPDDFTQYLRVEINHWRQILDILVRFRATQKQPSAAKALRARTPKY